MSAIANALDYVRHLQRSPHTGHRIGDAYMTCLIDGARRRAEWLERHRLVARASTESCPCLIGTKMQKCIECRRRWGNNGPCWAGRGHDCGWGKDALAHVCDHYKTWTRDGVKTIFTTEPYGINVAALDALSAWGERKRVAGFLHTVDDSFHYPGRTDLIAIMPTRAADEYAQLEPTAVQFA